MVPIREVFLHANGNVQWDYIWGVVCMIVFWGFGHPITYLPDSSTDALNVIAQSATSISAIANDTTK